MRSLATSTLMVAILAGLGTAQSARNLQQVSTGPNPSSNNANNGRSIAKWGRVWLACWADQFGTTDATEDIYASISEDGGITWSTPARVDVGDPANSTDSNFPFAFITEDPQRPGAPVFGCIWEESRLQVTPTGNGACDDVFAAWSVDGVTWTLSGTTIGPMLGVLNLGFGGDCSGTTAPDREIDERNVWASNGIIHVIWEEDGVNPGCTFGSESVYYSRSTDGGRNYEPPQELNLSNDPVACDVGIKNDVDNPYVAADGNIVCVCWNDDYFAPGVDNDTWVAVSLDGGFTFLPAIPIEAGGSFAQDLGSTSDAYCRVEGNTIVVVYQDNEFHGTDTAVCVVSTDAGMTWGQETDVSPATSSVVAAGIAFLDVALSGSTICVAYISDWDSVALNGTQPNNGGTNSNRQLYVSVSRDLGQTWRTDIDLDPGRANQECQISGEGTTFVVAAQTNPYGNNNLGYWVTQDTFAHFTYHEVANSTASDIDQAGTRNGRSFEFDLATLTGNSVAGWNFTGQNETYVAGVRTPGLTFGTPFPGQQAFFLTGVPQPTTGKLYGLFFGASGVAPASELNGQFLNLVVDGITVATSGVFNGLVGPTGSAASAAFPAQPTLGLWGIAAIVDLNNPNAILFSDPLAF